jgi:hypothetical protein
MKRLRGAPWDRIGLPLKRKCAAALLFVALVTAAGTSDLAAARDPAPGADARFRQRLHQQQLQGDLALRMQQDLARGGAGLSPADRQRMDRLGLEQRVQQDRLQQEQLLELRRYSRDPLRLQMLQRTHEQEQALQLQRFYAEQQRALGSSRAAPLQSEMPSGGLKLP